MSANCFSFRTWQIRPSRISTYTACQTCPAMGMYGVPCQPTPFACKEASFTRREVAQLAAVVVFEVVAADAHNAYRDVERGLVK